MTHLRSLYNNSIIEQCTENQDMEQEHGYYNPQPTFLYSYNTFSYVEGGVSGGYIKTADGRERYYMFIDLHTNWDSNEDAS